MSATIAFQFICPRCIKTGKYAVDMELNMGEVLKCYQCGYILANMTFIHYQT